MVNDPANGRPLPDSAIQRVVFVTTNVHVYGIPPITSTRGFAASSWTSPTQPTAKEIFTARLRIVETSLNGKLKTDLALEDGNTGELFAAAPYTSTAVVQQANDSSRFFAIRVVGEGGMKATLGIGFEERSTALDFNIALGEMRKVLGWETAAAAGTTASSGAQSTSRLEGANRTDFSLKEGEKIHIEVGSKGRRSLSSGVAAAQGQNDTAALFSIAPPPSAANDPPELTNAATAADVGGRSAEELGFDDGEFGEFQ